MCHCDICDLIAFPFAAIRWAVERKPFYYRGCYEEQPRYPAAPASEF